MAKVSKQVQAERDFTERKAENQEKFGKSVKQMLRMDDDSNGGKPLNIKDYNDYTMNLDGYELSFVYDDVVAVTYVDEGENGEINRGGMIIPLSQKDKASKPWRIGRVLLAGPQCQYTKTGDFVQFPDDKGVKAGSIQIEGQGKPKVVVFLNESRLFGKVTPKKTAKLV